MDVFTAVLPDISRQTAASIAHFARPERGRLRSSSGRGVRAWPSVRPMKTRILAGHDMTRLLEVVGIHEFMDLMIERLRARLLDHSAADVEVRSRDGSATTSPTSA